MTTTPGTGDVPLLLWVTGGSSGVGRAVLELAPEDSLLGRVDVSRSGGVPGTAHLPLDLTETDAWTTLREDVAERVRVAREDVDGPVGAVLVHAAGMLGPVGPAGTTDLDAYGYALVLDAVAPAGVGAAFLAGLADAGHTGPGEVLGLSSGAASSVYEGWSAYCAGKAALEAWTRVAGAEQARRRAAGRPAVRVRAVAPGVVDTGMQELVRDLSEEQFPAVGKFRQLHADGALSDPYDVASRLWELLLAPVDGADDDDRAAARRDGAVLDLREVSG